MEWIIIAILVAGLITNLLLLGTIASKINKLIVFVSLQGQFIHAFVEAFQNHWTQENMPPEEFIDELDALDASGRDASGV